MEIIAAILIFATAGWGQVGLSSMPIPESGVSEDEIKRLAGNADSLMMDRLEKSENGKNYRGLIYRLRFSGNLKKPNSKISKRLMKFIDKRSVCEGQVSADRIYEIGDALEALGQRGDEAAVEYLEKWVVTGDKAAQMRCFDAEVTAADFQELLRRRAVIGLGLNGTPEALKKLEQIKANPPIVKFPGSLLGVLDRAIPENKKIQEMGIEKFFESEISRIREHANRRRNMKKP